MFENVYGGVLIVLLSNICRSTYVQTMMTSSIGNIFRHTGHLCGESPVTGEFPAQRPVTRSFDVFFDLRLDKRLSKQSRGWWFETLSCPLWRHCNAEDMLAPKCRIRPVCVLVGIVFQEWRSVLHNILRPTCICKLLHDSCKCSKYIREADVSVVLASGKEPNNRHFEL